MGERIVATIAVDGKIRFVYTDRLAGLLKLGKATVTRASEVEPYPGGGWTAQMKDGPLLGPFTLRSEALSAEVAWLEKNVL